MRTDWGINLLKVSFLEGRAGPGSVMLGLLPPAQPTLPAAGPTFWAGAAWRCPTELPPRAQTLQCVMDMVTVRLDSNAGGVPAQVSDLCPLSWPVCMPASFCTDSCAEERGGLEGRAFALPSSLFPGRELPSSRPSPGCTPSPLPAESLPQQPSSLPGCSSPFLLLCFLQALVAACS